MAEYDLRGAGTWPAPHPRSSMTGTFVRGVVGALALFLAPIARPATAQSRPDPALEFAAGWVGFADDGIASERLVGAAARLYVLPRLSLGPEIAYIDADNHNHLTVTGNVTWDVIGDRVTVGIDAARRVGAAHPSQRIRRLLAWDIRATNGSLFRKLYRGLDILAVSQRL